MANENQDAVQGNAEQGNGTRPRPRLQRYYQETVRDRLMQEFGFASPMQIPKVEKVVINVGIGEAGKNPKLLDSVVAELGLITGQRPVVRRAKKAISNFALRQGMPVGVSVTLRRERMWEFLDRLINVSIPRIRDFRGLSTRSFDGRGNYTMGVKEQLIFPEIDYDKIEKLHGMDLTIVTSTDRDDEGLALLRELGMPFRGATPVAVNA
ncbi:50S ribosomal protein L5 [soil metagenome]|jgi:large subunit ribosomal protein L5